MQQKQIYDPFYVMVFTIYDENNRITPIITWNVRPMYQGINKNKLFLYTLQDASTGNYNNPLYEVDLSRQSYIECSGLDMSRPQKYVLVGFFDDMHEEPISIGDPITIDKESSYQTSLSPADPDWYVNLSLEDKKKLEPCYDNWKKTTTNLAVPLINVYRNNPDCASHIIWRTSSNRILFHADEEGRPPCLGPLSVNENPQCFVFSGGLTPPKPYGTLQMEAGIHIEAAESFSYLFTDTLFYLEESGGAEYLPASNDGQSCNYIYLVDAPGGLEVGLSKNDFSAFHEVSFPGGVLSKWIIGAFASKTFPTFFAFHRNPNYTGTIGVGAAPDGYVDIIISMGSPAWYMVFTGRRTRHVVRDQWIRLSASEGPYSVSAFDEKNNQLRGSWNFNEKTMASAAAVSLDLAREQGVDRALVINFSGLAVG